MSHRRSLANLLRFYTNRLRHASVPELAHRARHTLFVARLRAHSLLGCCTPAIPELPLEDVTHLEMPELVDTISDTAIRQALETGRIDVGSVLADAVSGADSESFRFFANVRPHRLSCDIRTLWEPARLQHATLLFVAARQETDRHAAWQMVYTALDSVLTWLTVNPFPYGPHYLSAMECGLRLPVLFYCLKNSANLDKKFVRRFVEAAYLHAWFVEHRLSLYSSRGNHTVCEAVGLVMAGAMFRRHGEGKRWLQLGIGLLEEEVQQQILPDGGPVEQSFGYHRFVLDLFWLATGFLDNNRLHDCTAMVERLTKGEDFLRAFQNLTGGLPAIGDSDSGYAVAPWVTPARSWSRSHQGVCTTFSDAGYSVLQGLQGFTVTFDHGPLGMAPLFNHGHADALSITVSLGGEEYLVDPGTYRYNGVPEYRRYFKGTRAHNTVTVDDADQAVQETGFIWSRPYEARLLTKQEVAGSVLLTAVHDGYSRLAGPVVHKRALLFIDEHSLVVNDTFSGEGSHCFDLHFHLHPDACVERDGDWWLIRRKSGTLRLCLGCDDTFELLQGVETPPLGWYSRTYGQMEESRVLRCRKEGSAASVGFTVLLTITDDLRKERLEAIYAQ